MTATLTTDSEARLTLPKEFANTPMRLEEIAEGVFLVRLAEDVTRPTTVLSDRDRFLELLDAPLEPNEELRRAFAESLADARHG